MLRVLVCQRPNWVSLLTVLTAAITLSACSSSSTPGLLTQADIPSYLGVKLNPSASASEARHGGNLAPGCRAAGNAAFGVPGVHIVTKLTATSKSPAILNGVESCSTTSKAHDVYATFVKYLIGRSVTGVGNEAKLTNLSGTLARGFGIVWRTNNQVALIEVEGPTHDKRITPALVELLARRAAARS